VLRELKEACLVPIDISVPQIVKYTSKFVLNELPLLVCILRCMHVELSRGLLEFVGLGRRASLANNFFNSALNVGSTEI